MLMAFTSHIHFLPALLESLVDYSTSESISIFSYISPGCLKFCCCAHATTFSQSISTLPSFHLLSIGKLEPLISSNVTISSPSFPFLFFLLSTRKKNRLYPPSLSPEIYRQKFSSYTTWYQSISCHCLSLFLLSTRKIRLLYHLMQPPSPPGVLRPLGLGSFFILSQINSSSS
jgi:hypothetical protein